jgi:ribosomal peptide maturation radical SAM protein 1
MFSQWIDYVFTGEADDSFPEWLNAYIAGEPDRPIPGIASRHGFQAGRPTANLDRLPIPSFDAYFVQRSALEDAGAAMRHVRHLPYESSRGCWWGESHHCTFCGLNNEGMLFRRKSSPRVVAELECLVERYGITSFMASDNILDFKAYTGLLGDLAATEFDLDLFYEIKANVSRANVAALRDAGVRRVQPGIESFSDHVLKIMRKGITGLQNVQALKWLQEYGIDADYNMLIGFPGETREDYTSAIALMRAIPHLPPPNGSAITVRVDRFSPFFEDSDALGIRKVRAAESYRHLIPPELGAAEDYAYFFDHDQSELGAFGAEVGEMNEVMSDWKMRRIERRARLGKGSVELLEAADSGRTRHIMRGIDGLIFVLADRVTSLNQLTEKLAGIADPATVRAAVARLVEANAIYLSHDHVVATVAYAVPHTQARLSLWLEQNGLPDQGHAVSVSPQDAMIPADGNGPAATEPTLRQTDAIAVG